MQGTLREHHRFLLCSHLRQLDFYDAQIAELDQEIARRLGVPMEPDDPEPGGRGPRSGKREPSAEPSPQEAELSPPSASQPPADRMFSQTEAMRILDEVTGINQRIAQIVLAELGRAVPGGQDQCGQTPEQQNGQGQPLAAPGAH